MDGCTIERSMEVVVVERHLRIGELYPHAAIGPLEEFKALIRRFPH